MPATSATDAPPPLCAIVATGPDERLAHTLDALTAVAVPLEVLVAAPWPGPSPSPAVLARHPAARLVHEAGIGDAAAVNAALAVARAPRVVLLRAGDRVDAAVLTAHADLHGPAALVGAVAGETPPDRWWCGRRPAAPPQDWTRHVGLDRATVTRLGGLDDRLRSLDVAVLDLLDRLAAAAVSTRQDPALVLTAPAPDEVSRALEAGRAAHLLDVVTAARGGATRRVGSRLSAVTLRWTAAVVGRRRALAARVAFARGRGLPLLPAFPADRAGLTATRPRPDRPPVSVVVPFGGAAHEVQPLRAALAGLELGPQDEVVVVDNAPTAVADTWSDRVRVVPATGQRSSYHARNAGVRASRNPWLLFFDADCLPVPWILDAFFADPPGDRTGAVAGAVLDPPDAGSWVGRYSRDAAVLSQGRALARAQRPYAVTACLLVRRAALLDVGGFTEGIRSSGDADLCWRLAEAGWELEHRARAAVEHRHRSTLRGLLRQYGKYGAGVRWLESRWPGTAGGWPRYRRPDKVRAALVDVVGGRPASARMHAMDVVCEWAAARGARRPNTVGGTAAGVSDAPGAGPDAPG